MFHMHGYEAALVVNDEVVMNIEEQPEIFHQEEQVYISISIRKPMLEPFRLIPNAYKSLMTHMKINGIKQKRDKKIIECFEKEYVKDGTHYMGIYIAVE